MDWMPARMISQKKAASNKVKVIKALANAPTLMGSLLPNIQAPNQGTRKKNQKITSTKGSDRIRLTYAPAKADSSLMGDKRISASAAQTQKASREVQNLMLNPQGLEQTLQDGDVLTLLPISPAFANAVTLQGTVAQALRYPWMSNMRISDLIPDREALITPDYYKRKNKLVQAIDSRDSRDFLSDNQEVVQRINSMVDQINWDYAIVERLSAKDLRLELIPFNLGKAVLQKDPAHNLVLQPGDVVTILSSTDVQLPAERKTRLVRIEGEVAAPGVYQALAGETVSQARVRQICRRVASQYVSQARVHTRNHVRHPR
jgi:protein involved in polysaccharide export with SLBB domain